MSNKQVWKNMVFSIVSFIVTYAVNFFLTPYVSKHLPGAYGYVKLSNDIVSYAEIVTLALNSMAGRFISVEFNRGDTGKAGKYFSSVLCANIAMVFLLLIPSGILISKLDSVFHIDAAVVWDVKILFACTFLSFFISVIFSVYALAAFIKNRLDYEYEVSMVVSLIRLAMLAILFGLMGNKVYFIGITALVMALAKAVLQYMVKRKILPELKIDYKLFDIRAVIMLISTGIWNTVQKLGQILLDGLDTVISNIFISPLAMNNISFAKTMPGIIASLLNTMAGVFSAQYTILYAKGKRDELKRQIKQSMLFLSLVISIPVGIIIAIGKEFYSLWIPNEDVMQIYILSVLSSMVYIVSTPMNAVYNLFTVKNRVRYLALLTIASGVLSSLTVLTLLKMTGLGVYAVAGCSSVIGILRNLFLVAPYAAKMMGYPSCIFYPEIFKSALSVFFVYFTATVVKGIVIMDSWPSFFVVCFLATCLGFAVNFVVLLNREEKKILLKKIDFRKRNRKI